MHKWVFSALQGSEPVMHVHVHTCMYMMQGFHRKITGGEGKFELTSIFKRQLITLSLMCDLSLVHVHVHVADLDESNAFV